MASEILTQKHNCNDEVLGLKFLKPQAVLNLSSVMLIQFSVNLILVLITLRLAPSPVLLMIRAYLVMINTTIAAVTIAGSMMKWTFDLSNTSVE